MSRASTKLRYRACPKKMMVIKFYFLDWPPRQPMSTGPRPRTLVTTWATTGPGQYTTDRIFNVNICSGNSNGSTPPARTTTRSPLTGLPVGSPSTTGQKNIAPSYPHRPSLKRFHQNKFPISFSFLHSTIHMNSLLIAHLIIFQGLTRKCDRREQ